MNTVNAASHLSSGRVVGRFVYTSRGTQGWGVADLVGTVPDEVESEVLSHVERLVEQTVPGTPSLDSRARRMVWGGTPGSPWRFLFQTVTAGDDASRRPHNNVTDCIVIRQQPTGPLGIEPARLWSSPGWQTPYGPDEVSGIDLAALGAEELVLPFDDHGNPLAMLAVAAATNNEPSLLHNVASLVVAIANGAGGPGRGALIALVDDVEFAPIFLGAATSVVPFDVAWDLPLEVRSVGFGTPPLDGSGIIALAREHMGEVGGLEILDLGGAAAAPASAARGRCPKCQEPMESWGSLVSQCLNGLAAVAARPDSDPDWVSGLAESLAALVSDAASTRVASADLVGLFSEPALTASGRLELAQLFDSETAWRLLARDHSHPPPRLPVIVPPMAGRQAAPPPARPKWPPARVLLESQQVRLDTTLQYLSSTRPSEATFWVADWVADQAKQYRKTLPLDVHRELGQPGGDTFARLAAFSDLDEWYEGVFAWPCAHPEDQPLGLLCMDIFLSDVSSACVNDKHRKLDIRDAITASRIAEMAKSVPDPTWPESLLGPRVRNFVRYWLEEKPRRGYPSGLLAEGVDKFSVGYILLHHAIERSKRPLDLLFTREALIDIRNRGLRNEQFARQSHQLVSVIDRRLAVLAPDRPPIPGGSYV